MESEEYGGNRRETGTFRAHFDGPDVPLIPTGLPSRVIVAIHPATATASPIGVALCHWPQCNSSPYRYTDEKERGILYHG